jgi:hypothetical protein
MQNQNLAYSFHLQVPLYHGISKFYAGFWHSHMYLKLQRIPWLDRKNWKENCHFPVLLEQISVGG